MHSRYRTTSPYGIDIIQDEAECQHPKRFKPGLLISVQVDGPIKVVKFSDDLSELQPVPRAKIGNANSFENVNAPSGKPPRYGEDSHQKNGFSVLRLLFWSEQSFLTPQRLKLLGGCVMEQ